MSSESTEVAQKQGPRSRCYGRLGWHWARSNVRLGLDVSCRQRDWEQGLGAYRVTCCCPCGSSGHRKLVSGSTAQGWAPLSGVPRGHNGHDASGPARACALLQAHSLRAALCHSGTGCSQHASPQNESLDGRKGLLLTSLGCPRGPSSQQLLSEYFLDKGQLAEGTEGRTHEGTASRASLSHPYCTGAPGSSLRPQRTDLSAMKCL